MTDSIRILPPGFQVTNSAGTPQAGAVLRFYDAGTSNTRTVYSNLGLTTSLGVTVTTNSAGRPAASGGVGAEVLIYTGITAYKITAETSLGVALWSFDNVIGALDTSSFLPDLAIPVTIVSTKTADYAILTTDQGTLFYGNCTSGLITFTLPSAVTAGNGFRVGIKHVGTLNFIRVAPTGGQTLEGVTTSKIIPIYGSVRWVVSDGANWSFDVISDPIPLIPATEITPGQVGFTVDLTPFDAYNRIRVVITGIKSTTNNVGLAIRTSSDGGVTADTGVADYAWVQQYNQCIAAGTVTSIGDDADTNIVLYDNALNTTGVDLEVIIADPSGVRKKFVSWTGLLEKAAGGLFYFSGGGARNASAVIDHIYFFFTAVSVADTGGTYTVSGDL